MILKILVHRTVNIYSEKNCFKIHTTCIQLILNIESTANLDARENSEGYCPFARPHPVQMPLDLYTWPTVVEKLSREESKNAEH